MVEGAWTCERCGVVAPSDAQSCRNCGAPLPAYDDGEDAGRHRLRHWSKTVFSHRTPPPPPPPEPPPGPPPLPPEEPDLPPPPVIPLHGHGTVEGVARTVQLRTEVRGSGGNTGTTIVCTFRVEVLDPHGRPVRLVPVEMRGNTFEGAVAEGDRVRAEGKAKRGTLRVRRLYNLTTGAEVSTRGTHWAVAVLVLLVFAAWMVFVIFFAGR